MIAAQALLERLLTKRIAIYGVTTGFGDSCRNAVDAAHTEELQRNLVAYLQVGTGAPLPQPAVRAMMAARLVSLTRGHSGVTEGLVDQLLLLLQHDLLPVVPSEGSLGASGDLVPLAYLASLVQGKGLVATPNGDQPAAEAFAHHGMQPYVLKAKEGLALVNGTSAMTGMCGYNYAHVVALTELAAIGSAWVCRVLDGNPEAFGTLVNEKAKQHEGQRRVAERIRQELQAESYAMPRATPAMGLGATFTHPVQDRYSLRCAPQILGPVHDTLSMVATWLDAELNSVSDNPLLDAADDTMATGGNFYGGYLGHGMDYLKISVASMTDMLDRQLMLVFDPKTAGVLPPNLVPWSRMRPEQRHLHHGLKGLHQVTNALTAEVMGMAMPSTVFSRSSESHNQDKVSLGMTAAVSLAAMVEKTFSVTALYFACLAQALDLREIVPQSPAGAALYARIRQHVPFVESDRVLGPEIQALATALKRDALARAGS